jgi:hypothetical protein
VPNSGFSEQGDVLILSAQSNVLTNDFLTVPLRTPLDRANVDGSRVVRSTPNPAITPQTETLPSSFHSSSVRSLIAEKRDRNIGWKSSVSVVIKSMRPKYDL